MRGPAGPRTGWACGGLGVVRSRVPAVATAAHVAASWGAIERYDVRADGSYWQSGMSEPCWRFASRGHGEAVANSPDLPYHEGCHEVGLYKLSSVYP